MFVSLIIVSNFSRADIFHVFTKNDEKNPLWRSLISLQKNPISHAPTCFFVETGVIVALDQRSHCLLYSWLSVSCDVFVGNYYGT